MCCERHDDTASSHSKWALSRRWCVGWSWSVCPPSSLLATGIVAGVVYLCRGGVKGRLQNNQKMFVVVVVVLKEQKKKKKKKKKKERKKVKKVNCNFDLPSGDTCSQALISI